MTALSGMQSPKNFVRNLVKEVKLDEMYHFESVKILAWKVKQVQI